MQARAIPPHHRSPVGGGTFRQQQGHPPEVGEGAQTGPDLFQQGAQRHRGTGSRSCGQGILQPGKLEQVVHQFLQTQQLPLQTLHQHRVAAVDLGGEAVANQQQGGEGRAQFVGDITHPALLLIELGFQRAAVLDHHTHPAVPTRQGEQLQLLIAPGQVQPLGTIAPAGVLDHPSQVRVRAETLQRLTGREAGRRGAEQLLGPGVDHLDPIEGIEDQPAHGSGVDPAQQPGSFDGASPGLLPAAVVGDPAAQGQSNHQGQQGNH